jgi:hypothetical protein
MKKGKMNFRKDIYGYDKKKPRPGCLQTLHQSDKTSFNIKGRVTTAFFVCDKLHVDLKTFPTFAPL